jgi:hypothetical protein
MTVSGAGRVSDWVELEVVDSATRFRFLLAVFFCSGGMDVEMMGVAALGIAFEAKMSSISAMDQVYWRI